MAWDVSVVDKYNVGNKVCVVLSAVADAATQNVATGLDVITHFNTGKQSVTAGTNQVVLANAGSTSTSIAGYLGCSGFTSGDEMFIAVYGR